MTESQLTEGAIRFELLATCGNALLAVEPLAQHFGLTLAEAEAILKAGWGVIVPRLGVTKARAALPLLASLGLQVTIQQRDALPAIELLDVSVRLADAAELADLATALSHFGVHHVASADDFRGPSGLVMGGLSKTAAERIQHVLRPMRSVQVTLSARDRARYDIIASDAALLAGAVSLMRFIEVMGFEARGPTPALATGLDRRSAQLLLSRFPDAGLIAVNQAFQRYDLCVTGPGRLSMRELQDFLATRGAAMGDSPRQIISGKGLRVEKGLSRSHAQQFLADYATIGIPARAELNRN